VSHDHNPSTDIYPLSLHDALPIYFESAILQTLAPGAYTAIVRGKNGGTGVGLVEVYDADPSVNAKLTNISTRGFVGTGDNVMIRSEEHTSELQSHLNLVCRLLLEK